MDLGNARQRQRVCDGRVQRARGGRHGEVGQPLASAGKSSEPSSRMVMFLNNISQKGSGVGSRSVA